MQVNPGLNIHQEEAEALLLCPAMSGLHWGHKFVQNPGVGSAERFGIPIMVSEDTCSPLDRVFECTHRSPKDMEDMRNSLCQMPRIGLLTSAKPPVS